MVGKLPAGPQSVANDSVKIKIKKKRRGCLKELKCKLPKFRRKNIKTLISIKVTLWWEAPFSSC